jgi:hypothetical protein
VLGAPSCRRLYNSSVAPAKLHLAIPRAFLAESRATPRHPRASGPCELAKQHTVNRFSTRAS